MANGDYYVGSSGNAGFNSNYPSDPSNAGKYAPTGINNGFQYWLSAANTIYLYAGIQSLKTGALNWRLNSATDGGLQDGGGFADYLDGNTATYSVPQPGGWTTGSGGGDAVSPAPYLGLITSYSEISGAVGDTVTIVGLGFLTPGSVTDVKFNGVSVGGSLVVVSDTEITCTIPAGATTGVITVISPTVGTMTGDSFTVTGGGGGSNLGIPMMCSD